MLTKCSYMKRFQEINKLFKLNKRVPPVKIRFVAGEFFLE